jgi:Transposase
MAAPRKYPIELKERAIRLWRSEQPRRPIAHVARELGVHPEVLEIPVSTFYGWVSRRRRPSPRDTEEVWLGEQIERIHKESDGTYGPGSGQSASSLVCGLGGWTSARASACSSIPRGSPTSSSTRRAGSGSRPAGDGVHHVEDRLDLGGVAGVQDGHLRQGAHERDVVDGLMGDASRRGEAGQEPQQPHPEVG